MGGLEVIIPMDQYLAESRHDMAMTLGGGLVMCLLVLGILSVGTRWTVSRPLAQVAERMAQFMRQQPDDQASGQTPALPRGDEAAYLAQSFSKMAEVIRSQQNALQEANASLEQRVQERTAELRRTTAEKERIGSELRIASEIQKSILPRTFPPFPDRSDFEIYATTIPALEMGGDFYVFFLIDRKRLGVVIADVSGKGVPAAILMAVCRTLLKATAMQNISAGECLRYVNDVLVSQSDPAMFVTIFYGILHTDRGRLEYCLGGHNPPFLLRKTGDLALLDQPLNVLVGAFEHTPFQTGRVQLNSGDAVVLYTDGVTEAVNAQREEYSMHRLRTVVERTAEKPVEEIVKTIIEEVRTFSVGLPQSDDTTALALRYFGN